MTLGTDQKLKSLDTQLLVEMDGISLREAESGHELLLGCWFKSNLKWSKHIQEVCGKLKKRLVADSRLKFVLPFLERKLVADGLINSVIAYCLPLFGGCNRNDIKDLQVLQNKAARIICHAPRLACRNKMFDNLDWLSVRQMIDYYTLIAVYRIRMSGEPEYFAKVFNNVNRKGSIIVQNTRLSLFQSSFRIRGASQWNCLPQNVREAPKISQFKNGLKQWIKMNVPRFFE